VSPSPAALDAARAVADAVLYEGYLLYPYRAGAAKNRSRWQFGVLGPPPPSPSSTTTPASAAAFAFAEPPGMSMQCLLAASDASRVTVRLRFLQLQTRSVERRSPDGTHTPVGSLTVGDTTHLTWDEAVAHELTFPDLPPHAPQTFTVTVPGASDVSPLPRVGQASPDPDGRIVRRRWPLRARVTISAEADGGLTRLTVAVANEHPAPVTGKEAAIRHSLIAAHLILEAHAAMFVSVREPIPAAARCVQDRCWPVLAGPPGETGLLLGAPIILYDHPRLAEQSPGDLFDACEIDELLTLRVRTMTDTEKAEARATDPHAAAIIDRCDNLTGDDLLRLHGTRHDPPPDPTLARGALVRLRPSRRADAQDMFLTGRIAVVNQILTDVDDTTHVAVALIDDPAAELHNWYNRYLHFAPEELEPLTAPPATDRPLAAPETVPAPSHHNPAGAHRCLEAGETAVFNGRPAGDAGRRVLVAGIGNIFLGDDGFGPEVARHLGLGEPLPDGVRLADYGIRGLHLAHDLLGGYDALVLVDALPGDGRPGRVEVIEVDRDGLAAGEFDGHGMDPLAVLASVARLGGTLPDTYVVGCRIATVDETIGLSEPVATAVPAAAAAVRTLVTRLTTPPAVPQNGHDTPETGLGNGSRLPRPPAVPPRGTGLDYGRRGGTGNG
jgi:hydrogenase maturation protease